MTTARLPWLNKRRDQEGSSMSNEITAPISAAATKMGQLMLAHFWDIALQRGVPLAEQGLDDLIEAKVEHLIHKTAKDSLNAGWSWDHQADKKNDYPGDIPSKWIDDFIYRFGKALPGPVTDFIRDEISPDITPGIRAQITEASTHEQVATLVGTALKDNAEAIVARLAGMVGGE